MTNIEKFKPLPPDSKVLVINLKLIGDLIVSTSAVSALKKSNPVCKITLLVRKGFEEVLSGNPDIDEIITYNKNCKNELGFWEKLKYEFSFIKKIRAAKYEIVIALHPWDKNALWAFLSGAKIRIGVSKQSFSYLFNKKIDVREDTISYLDYYRKITEPVSDYTSKVSPSFFVSDDDDFKAERILESFEIKNDEYIIGIHLGSSDSSKVIPSEKVVELLSELTSEKDSRIILFIGPGETINKEISSKFGKHVFQIDTSKSIKVLGALIKKCKLVISHDTSIKHIAVALKVKAITLIPKDILNTWDFYSESDGNYSIVGERNYSGSTPFLDNISIEDVIKKVKEIRYGK